MSHATRCALHMTCVFTVVYMSVLCGIV